MKDGWPPTPLGNVLEPAVRRVSTEPTTEYRLLGVRLEGEGPFLRETKLGSQISANSLNEVKTGDFIYSRLFAWRGAFGIINEKLDGCHVSNEFPLFRPINDQIDIRFLNYWFRLRSVINTVEADCSGSTPLTRNRYKEEFFLRLEIPLPPLSEQRRIVAKIEQLAVKVEEARGLRHQNDAIVSFLLIQGIKKLLQPAVNWRQSTISDCSQLSTGTTPPSHREEYFGGKIQWYTPGDLSFDKKLSRSTRTITELAVRDNKARLFEPGTILLVAIGGSLGKVGLTTETCSSNQQITGIKFIPEVDAEFGFWWLRSRYHELRKAAPEATLPILNQRRLGAISFSYPPLDEQRRIVAYLDGLQAHVDRLKALQAQTAAEVEALLPSILDQAFKGAL